MSRVYYDAGEKPEEVWAELADGSCRWRQTGSEVKVLVLRVPADLPAGRLKVDIKPYSIKGELLIVLYSCGLMGGHLATN
jgi:hypothetical protein